MDAVLSVYERFCASSSGIFPVCLPCRKVYTRILERTVEISDRPRVSPNASYPFPQDESSSSKSSGDDKFSRHAKNKHDERAGQDYLPIHLNE